MYEKMVGKKFILMALAMVIVAIPAAIFAATEEHSPMEKEIQELVAVEKAELVILNTQYSNAASSEEALSLQFQIQERKMATKVSFFSIQMKYAQERGDEERVRGIEAILETLVTTGSQGEPIAR